MSFLYYWGSSQSREGDDRMEAKLDALLRDRGIDPERIDDEVVHDVARDELRVTRRR